MFAKSLLVVLVSFSAFVFSSLTAQATGAGGGVEPLAVGEGGGVEPLAVGEGGGVEPLAVGEGGGVEPLV